MRRLSHKAIALFVGLAGCVTNTKPHTVVFEPPHDAVGAPFAYNAELAPRTTNVVIVSRDRGGQKAMIVNGHAIDAGTLVSALAKYVDRSSDAVIIDANATVPYSSILGVVGAAAQSGLCQVWAVNRVRGLSVSRTAAIELIPATPSCHPSKNSSDLIDDRAAQFVELYSSGAIAVNGRSESLSRLSTDFRAALAQARLQPDTHRPDVFLLGEPATPWGLMVGAFDAADQAGVPVVHWNMTYACGHRHCFVVGFDTGKNPGPTR